MAQEIIKDIPEDQVQDIIDSFEQEGCTTDKIKQDNGLYTVIANCPDK